LDDPSAQRQAEGRIWSALAIEASRLGLEDLVVAVLDDFSPAAIEDLIPQPLPPGGLWDPTFPPPPDPPPAPLHWRVFFDTSDARDRAADALKAQFADLSIDAVEVSDDDWAARSQRSLTAIRAGRFVVAPPWDVPDDNPEATTIVVVPSRGFGTGHHASTRLCLRALSAIEVTGARVLDLGTGSGVLAMAASIRGAREVLAIDVDPDAIDAARESAALNALPVAVEFDVADFRSASTGLKPGSTVGLKPPATAGLKPRHYDLVLANLTGGLLIQSAARVAEFLAPGGLLIMSGFDESERDGIGRAFAELVEVASYSEDGWVGLVLRSSVLLTDGT
jgi:ribosomal protein L11 methyltransferase